MQVNKVDYGVNFKADNGMLLREIRGHLYDDSKVLVRFSMSENRDIRTLEGYILENGRIVEGKGMGNTRGLSEDEIFPFIENLQNRAKAGVDFFKEFTRALISK